MIKIIYLKKSDQIVEFTHNSFLEYKYFEYYQSKRKPYFKDILNKLKTKYNYGLIEFDKDILLLYTSQQKKEYKNILDNFIKYKEFEFKNTIIENIVVDFSSAKVENESRIIIDHSIESPELIEIEQIDIIQDLYNKYSEYHFNLNFKEYYDKKDIINLIFFVLRKIQINDEISINKLSKTIDPEYQIINPQRYEKYDINHHDAISNLYVENKNPDLIHKVLNLGLKKSKEVIIKSNVEITT